MNEYPLNSNTSYYTIDRNDRIYVLPVAYKIYKMNKLFEKLLKIFKLEIFFYLDLIILYIMQALHFPILVLDDN